MTALAPSLTNEQRAAISTREVSVALSAGAGCGKTFVLTERFLNYFHPSDPDALQPHQLSHLVAITFTDRAAREMRDRIRRKCYERLLAAGGTDADYWAALVRSLDSARVSTIHSFCGALLRSNAVEARLDPRFGVLEQSQADTLLAEAIDDTLREKLAARDETTLDLVVRFGLDRVREMSRALVARRTIASLAAWRDRSPEEQLAAWQAFHGEVVVPAALRRVALQPDVQTLTRVLRENVPGHPVMADRRNVLLTILAEWQAESPQVADPAKELAQLRENARVQGGGTKKDWDSEEVYSQVRDGCEQLRKAADKVGGHLQFDVAAAAPCAAVGTQVLELALAVAERYQGEKTTAGVLDFNDLLSRAHQLLTDPAGEALRKRLGSQIHLLLVDEFQDTDPTQVELVKALCGSGLLSGKLFFVGDYKQSIYRFRGADPHVFRQLRDEIPPLGRLPLTLNFRSQPAILEFVNALFSRQMGSSYEPLIPHRAQVSPRPSVEFLWAPAEAAKESKEQLRRREADWIARKLRGLIDSATPLVWDAEAVKTGTPAARPARQGDMALLFRALSDVAYYEEALRKHGLDYYLVGGHAFYAQQEIFDLVNLLRTLESPADEVSLAGVLRSPMFSLADETLYWLARDNDGLAAGLFARLLHKSITAEQQQRVRFAAKTLGELRELKDRLPIAGLINEALARTGYDAALVAEFLGPRKLANLRKLVEQARSFDRAGMFTLADFIGQLSDFVAEQPDEPLAATHPEATDVIRLMTIHQAKGLEFPIVVVPDMDRATHGRNSPVEFTPTLGPLVKLPAAGDGTTVVGGYDLHALVSQEEEAAELDRLLYVATTRAADYLILSGGVPSLGAASGPWMRLLARRWDLVTGVPCDPMPGESAPRVLVTAQAPALTTPPPDGDTHCDLEALAASALELAAGGKSRIPASIAPIPVDFSSRRQYSFSRLAGKLHRVRILPEVSGDDALETAEPRIDPLGLGTLVHAVLEKLDFGAGDPSGTKRLVQRFAELHDVGKGEIAEACTLIERFLTSQRAKHLAEAQTVYPEIEFQLAWPPGGGQQSAYIGGFMDRLWQDREGRWHLIDFKTNKINANLDDVAGDYEMQMLVYALAAEQALGVAPASVTLHFLRTGDEKAFTWDAAARRRVVELVNDAIAKAAERETLPPVEIPRAKMKVKRPARPRKARK